MARQVKTQPTLGVVGPASIILCSPQAFPRRRALAQAILDRLGGCCKI